MNERNLKPFKRGDARINRNGRPKSFDALRTLTQQLAHEVARMATGEPLLAADGHALTVVEAIIRSWAHSKNPTLQIRFMELAFGKTPVSVEVGDAATSAIPIHVVDYRKGIAQLAPLDGDD